MGSDVVCLGVRRRVPRGTGRLKLGRLRAATTGTDETKNKIATRFCFWFIIWLEAGVVWGSRTGTDETKKTNRYAICFFGLLLGRTYGGGPFVSVKGN